MEADESQHFQATVLRLGLVVGQRTPTDDPNERQDNRVVECVLAIDAPLLLIGQRVIVRFVKPGQSLSTDPRACQSMLTGRRRRVGGLREQLACIDPVQAIGAVAELAGHLDLALCGDHGVDFGLAQGAQHVLDPGP